MKHTIYGKTGRAQLAVHDFTGKNVPERKRRPHPEFCVKLLPRTADRNTAFASAGDEVYFGPDLEKAMMHIKAWTGLETIELPSEIQKFVEKHSHEVQ